MAETWGERIDRQMPAERAKRDQGVAALREKIERLGPELDQAGPEAARRRLELIFRGAIPEHGADALAVVAADYVMRDRSR
ncbi:hypothetical protein AB0H28_27310 [Micromonospora sp. NPDC050980]|uniref:hypothetical protein n=1 Tax=Micromonospora sp. NPDC050980 TaxID=3155161 RepID=UPI0033E3FEA6